MILFLLISTFIISTFIIKISKYTEVYFFNISLLIITPPLIALIYAFLLLRANLIAPNIAMQLTPIINEISIIYIKSLLCFSLLLLISRKLLPPLLIPKKLNFPTISTIFIVFTFFASIEFIADQLGYSIHILILLGELSNLSLVLFICSLITNLKINKSFYKFLLISLTTIIIYFIFTFDKGFTIALFSSVFLILLGSRNLNFKVDLLKTNLLIISGGFLLPFLNFFESFVFNPGSQHFKYLGEVMESSNLLNYYNVFYNPECLYTYRSSLFNSIISPLKAFLGMKVSFHADKLMDICFPIEKANGGGKAFGLITEAALSNELPAFLYFSLAAILFILILEFFYYRFSLFGLLVYGQSIEMIYKLTRNDISGSIYFLLYTIIASYIITQTISFVDSYLFNKKYIN